MKKIFLISSFFFLLSIGLQAQDSDLNLVEKTLSYYLDGGTNNDFETLKKAFHPNATMKSIGDKGYREVNALEFFEKGMKAGKKQDRKTRIVSISITGMAANAQLEIEFPDFILVDYMNLLKIDGEWKIVNKIFNGQAKYEGS